MYILLDRQKKLVRVDRLDQVIGDLVTDGLVHDAFFFTFGHHHDRYVGVDLFDMGQCFQTSQTGHVLVEENNIERLLPATVDSILPTDHRNYFISFILQKQNVRFQQIDLIICPKYSVFLYCHIIIILVLTNLIGIVYIITMRFTVLYILRCFLRSFISARRRQNLHSGSGEAFLLPRYYCSFEKGCR